MSYGPKSDDPEFQGQSKWQWLRKTSDYRMSQMRFGDFDGDGTTDIFVATGKKWMLSWGAKTKWKKLNKSSYRVDRLRFGDQNNDGKTDVFVRSEGKWLMSSGGKSKWKPINGTSQPGFKDLGKKERDSGNYVGDTHNDKFTSDLEGCPGQ